MFPSNKKKKLTIPEAQQKIYRYCAYQERSHQEVRNKLFEFGLSSNQVEEIIVSLITEGFLSEERFSKAFAGGKFRIKNWGRIKITKALEAKGVSSNCIKIGLQEIDETEYQKTLRTILQKKAEQTEEQNIFIKRDKIASFAIQKGFEPDLVWNELKSLLPDK